ncbi:MAG: hypothetical protein OXH15_01175 [Gammaproteobacteria bacterium]|nr:hypothetical protein [Gammaproteobacteria bacterium]
MVAADDQEGVVEFAPRPQLFNDDAKAPVNGLAFTEVVRGVLADVVHIREERGQPAFQLVRLDPPQGLARTTFPRPMGIGRAPPVAERRTVRTRVQKGAEVLPGLVVKGFLGTV